MVQFGSIQVSDPLSCEPILDIGSSMDPDYSDQISGLGSVFKVQFVGLLEPSFWLGIITPILSIPYWMTLNPL